MLPNYQARSLFVLKHTTSSMYICMYVWMVRMPFKRVCGCRFFFLKTRLLRLDPTFFWYYRFKQVLLETWAPNCERIPAKTLVFQVTNSCCDRLLRHWRPFARLNFQNFAVLGDYEVPIVGCQDPPVVRMP